MVTRDWAAVAMAINQRMLELRLSQNDVVRRSGLAKQTVGEIQHNIVERRRSPRTVEALSRALHWHPGHLAAVSEGRTPPRLGEPHVRSADDVTGRLDAIEYRLTEIAEHARGIKAVDSRLSELSGEVEAAVERTVLRLRRPSPAAARSAR